MATEQGGRAVVGVIGAGTMGAGIAQLALENGHEVVLHDVDEAAIERGRARVAEGLARRAARLDLDSDSMDDWVAGRLARLRDAHSLDAVGAEAEIVIEAALEDLELKQTIFGTLDAAAAPEVILATNTSALSVAAIGARVRHRERLIGLHFFNPAPVIPLVEVIVPAAADRAVADRAVADRAVADRAVADRASTLVEHWGKTVVRCADSPGFIVNRVNRPFTLEALAMVEAGDSSVESVDAALRSAGFPMGPFELMDLVGIDVNLAVAGAIWEGFARADRFRPSPIQERLVAAGRLGRKSGSGFFDYAHGRRGSVSRAFAKGGAGRLADEAIVERIELAVVAEAWRAAGDGIAAAADIDLAIRLGAGHPSGPFERTADFGGPAGVLARLDDLRGLGPRFEPPDALVAAAGEASRPTIDR